MPEAVPHLPGDEAVAPPRLAARKLEQRVWFAIWFAVLLACGALLFFFNPAQHGFYPRCAFYQVTGWQCPGCGGLRAAHQLLHGQVLEAFRLNALAVLALPLVAWLLWRNWARGGARVRVRWVWLGLAGLVAFGVMRNLPGLGWLAP
jgi:hypothetical protein